MCVKSEPYSIDTCAVIVCPWTFQLWYGGQYLPQTNKQPFPSGLVYGRASPLFRHGSVSRGRPFGRAGQRLYAVRVGVEAEAVTYGNRIVFPLP